jgi:hypothetical protein
VIGRCASCRHRDVSDLREREPNRLGGSPDKWPGEPKKKSLSRLDHQPAGFARTNVTFFLKIGFRFLTDRLERVC